MIINITPELIKRLKKEGFYADEMFSLIFALKALEANEIEMLDEYDDFNSSKRAILTYQTLYRKGLIDRAREGSPIHYRLTEQGTEFLKDLERKPKEKMIDWIEDWINLFPEKNQNGILRSNIEDVNDRMIKFLKKYKYSKDIIFAATKSYLIQESSNEFFYTKRAMYFINKAGEGSLLASWCQNVLENKGDNGELYDGSRTILIQTVN